ncbi:hypothetical protein [Dokdonella sp.]|uniref:hypothetical protein n=1 Tax=Dokdonella sp. TaxID=2291710 RepID=UPI0035276E6B
MATWEWACLGPGVSAGIGACVSSWNRMAPNTIPTGAKAGGYLSGQLTVTQAHRHNRRKAPSPGLDGSARAPARICSWFSMASYFTPASAASSMASPGIPDALARRRGIEVIERDMP